METEAIVAYQPGAQNWPQIGFPPVAEPPATPTILAHELLPRAVSPAIRKAIPTHRFRRGDALEYARKSPRVLWERGGVLTEPAESIDCGLALAAYVDRRRWRDGRNIYVGIECSIHLVPGADGTKFLVEGRADGEDGPATLQVQVAGYREAREVFLAVIEATGKWLDPCWFDRVIRSAAAIRQRRDNARARNGVARNGVQDTKRAYREMSAVQRRSAWITLCRTLRAMCRHRVNRDVAFSAGETRIILEVPHSAVTMQLSLEEHGIVKVTSEKRELVRMVLTRRRGFAFLAGETLFSGPCLAAELFQELCAPPMEAPPEKQQVSAKPSAKSGGRAPGFSIRL